jgi:DNA-binding NarL/FixJ family response regulator
VRSIVEARRSDLAFDAIVMAGRDLDEQDSELTVDGTDGYSEPLTARERQVLALMAEGLPNKAIAGQLGISDQTVKFHVSSISGKLGAANRTDAVRRAVRSGLITL